MIWLIFAGTSALLSAAAAVVQKKILYRLSPLEFSFGVSVVVLVFSLAVPLSGGGIPLLPVEILMLIVGKSMLGAAAFLCVMTALGRNQISTALPLLGLTPAVVALLSVPALGESLGLPEVMALGLMMAGTYLIEMHPGRLDPKSVSAVAPASLRHRFSAHAPIAGALLLFAVSSLADKKLVSSLRVDPSAVLVYQHIVYCCVFGAMTAFRTRFTHAVLGTQTDHPAVGGQAHRSMFVLMKRNLPAIVLAAVLTLAYRFAQLEAAQTAPIALVLAVKRTSILFASLSGGTLFSDDRLGVKLAGAALIVGAGFLIIRFCA